MTAGGKLGLSWVLATFPSRASVLNTYFCAMCTALVNIQPESEVIYFFATVSHRLALNSLFSCLYPLSSRITGMITHKFKWYCFTGLEHV